MSAPLMRARGVAVELGGAPVLEHADLTLEAGRLVAVVGPNGAGKSTFVRSIAGLQRARAGEIEWRGRAVGELRGRALARIRAFVPQRASVPDGVTVAEAVRIGRSAHIPLLGRATRTDRDAVERALERAGVAEMARRRLTTLSGGELQRVQVAVALAQDAPALIADEPTAHLDLGAAVRVGRLLRGLAREGIAVLLVAHDLALAAGIADEVVVMANGRTVATGPPGDALAPELVAGVWEVDARLEHGEGARTALHVDWLGTTPIAGATT